jgi:hypothetical protein
VVPDDGLPAIPVSAGALIYDPAGRLLTLKPTYKTGWTIPGGVRFLFDCGTADDAALASITMQPEEVAEYRLVPLTTRSPCSGPRSTAASEPRRGTADASTWKTAARFPASPSPGNHDEA